MKDIRDFIKIADVYGKEASKKVNEGFGDWLAQKLGITPPQAEEIAQAAEAEAEKQGVDTDALDQVTDTSRPATTGTRDLSNFNDEYLQRAVDGVGRSMVSAADAQAELDRRAAQTSGGTPPEAQTTAPAQPQTPATDTTSRTTTPRTDEPAVPIDGDVAPERPAQPATDTQPAAVDAAAGVTPAARTRTAAPDTTDDARAARTNAPAQPNQLLSGLPAKLSQIRSANLMKDYNAGGKQPMDKVRDVQLALSRLGHDPNGIDGKYGPGTFKAVQEFQKANGLSVDGQVGPNTIRAMIDKLGRASLADISSGDSAADVAQDDAARTATTPTQQNQSKDLSMKTAMNESASMNVSMTGDNAAEVAELMKLLKNAGMPDASPVKDIMPPMAPKGDMADFMGMVDSGMQGPAEPCSVCGEVHEETSCSEGTEEYDAIIDEWDNSPEEEYKDHNYMTQDLSGGINRPKKAYAKAQDGDNAMAVEAIKSDLRKALEEALKGK